MNPFYFSAVNDTKGIYEEIILSSSKVKMTLKIKVKHFQFKVHIGKEAIV